MHGTSYLYAPLVSHSSYSSFDSKRGGQAKDLLFFDVTSKTAHWLLADSTQRLRSYSLIFDPPLPRYRTDDTAEEAERKALGVLFESVPGSPRDDPAAGGHASVGFAASDGTDPAILIDGISGVLGHHLASAESLIVFYNRGGELWAAEIMPATRSILFDARVSAAPHPQSQ